MIFIMKDKSRRQQVAHSNQHQRYLTEKAKVDLHKSRPDLKIADTVVYYHNMSKMPADFRKLLDNIHNQYSHLATMSLANEQRFTLNKLVGTRLPEILEDYLALDSDFAKNTIIDKSQNLTSHAVTCGQLYSMSNFMQRVAEDGQADVANNILANRNYLKTVYGGFYQDEIGIQTSLKNDEGKAENLNDFDKLNIIDEMSSTEAFNSNNILNNDVIVDEADKLYALGESYLEQSDDLAIEKTSTVLALAQHKVELGECIIIVLGQLVSIAERTLIYADAVLPSLESLRIFDFIMSHTIPRLLTDSLINNQATILSDGQQANILEKVIRFGQLLEVCMNNIKLVVDQQSRSNTVSVQSMNTLQSTLINKQRQAQYLLDNGFFKI